MWNLLLVSLSLAGQTPTIEIVEPRATYGHLGAVRPKGGGVLPGDVVDVSFGVKNLKADENGLSKFSVAIEIRDPKGQVLFGQKPINSVAQNVFGGDIIPTSVTVSIPPNQKPSELNWTITVADRLTDAKTELKGSGKVLPADFGLVRIGTYADAESRVPVAPTGVVGGLIYLNFSAVGFQRDAKEKKPNIEIELKVVDADGKPTLPKAMKATIREDIPSDALQIPLHFALPLNRPGRFTVEVSARCAVSNETSSFSLPVRILPLD